MKVFLRLRKRRSTRYRDLRFCVEREEVQERYSSKVWKGRQDGNFLGNPMEYAKGN